MAFRIHLICPSNNSVGIIRNTGLSKLKLGWVDCILHWQETYSDAEMLSEHGADLLSDDDCHYSKAFLNCQKLEPQASIQSPTTAIKAKASYYTGNSPVASGGPRKYFRSCSLILSFGLYDALQSELISAQESSKVCLLRMDMGKFCLKSIETAHLRKIQLDSALYTHTRKKKKKL